MPKYTFTGSVEQVFPSHIDKATGGTLVAEPGKTYDIKQVDGLTVPDGKGGLCELELPMPPTDDFKPAKASASPSGSN